MDPYNRPMPTYDTAPVAGSEGVPEWDIEAIVNKRISKWGRKKKTKYIVRWKGYGPEWNSWYAEDDLPNAQESIAGYKSNNLIVRQEA